MPLYGLPRRPIFWKLDPRTIARDDTEVRFMDARAEKRQHRVRAAAIGAASFKICAPDNDFANLARSSLRERAESYALMTAIRDAGRVYSFADRKTSVRIDLGGCAADA